MSFFFFLGDAQFFWTREIRDQVYDEKQNLVTITVVCCSPEKIRDKLCCKGGKVIKSIEIVEPPKPKPPPEKPKEPEKPKPPLDEPDDTTQSERPTVRVVEKSKTPVWWLVCCWGIL